MKTNTGAIRPTPLEMSDFLVRHPEVRSSADLAAPRLTRVPSASVCGFCDYLFAKLDLDGAGMFLSRVADGDEVPSDHPIGQLRRRITRLRVRGGRVNGTEGLALTIQTWNSVRARNKKLRVPKGALTN